MFERRSNVLEETLAILKELGQRVPQLNVSLDEGVITAFPFRGLMLKLISTPDDELVVTVLPPVHQRDLARGFPYVVYKGGSQVDRLWEIYRKLLYTYFVIITYSELENKEMSRKGPVLTTRAVIPRGWVTAGSLSHVFVEVAGAYWYMVKGDTENRITRTTTLNALSGEFEEFLSNLRSMQLGVLRVDTSRGVAESLKSLGFLNLVGDPGREEEEAMLQKHAPPGFDPFHEDSYPMSHERVIELVTPLLRVLEERNISFRVATLHQGFPSTTGRMRLDHRFFLGIRFSIIWPIAKLFQNEDLGLWREAQLFLNKPRMPAKYSLARDTVASRTLFGGARSQEKMSNDEVSVDINIPLYMNVREHNIIEEKESPQLFRISLDDQFGQAMVEDQMHREVVAWRALHFGLAKLEELHGEVSEETYKKLRKEFWERITG